MRRSLSTFNNTKDTWPLPPANVEVGPPQVAFKVAPIRRIVEMTTKAWFELPRKIFEAAWVVCGLVEPNHFDTFRSVGDVGITSETEAKKLFDPCNVLHGSSLQPTPQLCTRFVWQVLDEDL